MFLLEWWWWTITFSYSSIYKSVQQHINNRDNNWKKQRAQVDISKAQVNKKNSNEEESPQHKLNSIKWLELPIAKKRNDGRGSLTFYFCNRTILCQIKVYNIKKNEQNNNGQEEKERKVQPAFFAVEPIYFLLVRSSMLSFQ